MRVLIALALSLALSGCSFWKSEVIVYRDHYVLLELPSDLTDIPTKVDQINLDDVSLDQKVVSDWVNRRTGRENKLESQVIGIKELQEKRKIEILEKNKNK